MAEPLRLHHSLLRLLALLCAGDYKAAAPSAEALSSAAAAAAAAGAAAGASPPAGAIGLPAPALRALVLLVWRAFMGPSSVPHYRPPR